MYKGRTWKLSDTSSSHKVLHFYIFLAKIDQQYPCTQLFIVRFVTLVFPVSSPLSQSFEVWDETFLLVSTPVKGSHVYCWLEFTPKAWPCTIADNVCDVTWLTGTGFLAVHTIGFLSWHCAKRDWTDAGNDALLALCARLDGLLWPDERLLLPDQPVGGHGGHGGHRPTCGAGQQLVQGVREGRGGRGDGGDRQACSSHCNLD